MTTVQSADGTLIAYERVGTGPALILVDGALCYRASGPNAALAAELAGTFSVITYDRRGRGESNQAGPYAVEREVEDLAALIAEAGGSAFLYGISSGGALVLEAAAAGLPVDRLAIYEVPFIVDDTRAPLPADYVSRLDELVRADRRAAAVRMFMRDGVGLPKAAVALMGVLPAWSKLKGVAHTLPHDTALVAPFQTGRPLPARRWAAVGAPALVIDGGKSPAWIRNAARELATVLPDAEHHTLEGQTHIVKPKALAPALAEFFAAALPREA